MFKNNYKAWGISIGLHVVIIYLVSRQTVEVQQPEKVEVMQAYVMVDLAAMPDINSSTQPAFESEAKLSEVEQSTKQPTEQPEAKLTTHDAKSHVDEPAIISKTTPQTKPSASSPKVELSAVEVLADKQKLGGDQQGTEQPFKKLNPYAPIPLVTAANEARNSFDYSQSAIPQSADEKLRLTVPKAHSTSYKSDVVWQSTDGSKRMEMYQGMCYDIDFNGVMGKAGLPQGSPRPCKDNDAILFDKIMDKWNRKKPLK
ncbi:MULTISPECIES: hypothetical protein [Pseudoalteromonas]|uniref:hypothetical protein n=1 Tax=Pseudoalteromonas TaxID=53246 RepID=UPI00038120BA|nr:MULTISPECIES: hypothetical protein [Pseudoalteromonas]MCF6145822.1 hypothetical protein [Pseudoalteromonas mariniglutinosa NCIMB 1770]TMN72100.1 hypothetical protein CWB85_07850 [Pseudoalteromonas sp. S1727]